METSELKSTHYTRDFVVVYFVIKNKMLLIGCARRASWGVFQLLITCAQKLITHSKFSLVGGYHNTLCLLSF